MKKYIPDPHFLLISFFVLVIISHGSSVKAQNEKEIKQTIIINNGDTIINGKKLSEANKEERARLRKEFKDMDKSLRESGNEERVIIRKRKGKGDGKEPLELHWDDGKVRNHNFDDKWPGGVHIFKFNEDSLFLSMRDDSLMNGFRFKFDGLDSNLRKRIITMHRDLQFDRPGMHERSLTRPFMERNEFPGFRRNNSSSFNYSYTDKDGISNRMNISISETEDDQFKKITGTKTIADQLDVIDFTIFPNFSSAKLGLAFNLANRGTTKVRILDSDLKVVFSDETANFSGNYVKQIPLLKNGLYYLSVSQNGKWFIRELIKE